MQHGNRMSFFQRMRMKYMVSVMNENTLENVFHWRISALRLLLWSILLVLLLLTLFSVLIFATPLRNVLPENIDATLRKEVVQDAITVDSLIEEVSLRQGYINTLRDAVLGNIVIDSSLVADSVLAKERSEVLMEKSAKEKEFCDKFEQEEQYNITTTSSSTPNLVFFKPVVGIPTLPFDRAKKHLGVDIATKDDAPVVAVYQGMVMYAGYNPVEGYIVQILHPEGYISVYKGASMVFKSSGDIVKTGDVIAVMDHSSPVGCVLHFELWNKMKALDPAKYIVLE